MDGEDNSDGYLRGTESLHCGVFIKSHGIIISMTGGRGKRVIRRSERVAIGLVVVVVDWKGKYHFQSTLRKRRGSMWRRKRFRRPESAEMERCIAGRKKMIWRWRRECLEINIEDRHRRREKNR